MHLPRLSMAAAAALLLGACGTTRAGSAQDGGMAAAGVDADTARVRTATAAFRQLDSAVAVGYAPSVARCIGHPQHGVMGFHHTNRALMDDRVEVERPEILLYSREEGGEYRLNGVEYIVPYTARSREATPPRVMGQALKRSDELQLWYLHVWVWRENPAGLFADWNPTVRC